AARTDFERAIALRGATRWAYVGLCGVHTLRGDFAEALRQAEAAERHGAFSGLTWKGEARRRGGDLAGAARDLERALETHPHRIGALLNLALVRGAQGD